MAVLPTDLTSPVGKIDSAFFPGEDAAVLNARLQTYVTEGNARASALVAPELDEAVKNWAYYRAFEAVHLRLIATPSSVDITGEGSVAYTGSQIASFGEMAARFKAAFEAMLTVEDLITPAIPSGGVPNSYRF